MEPPNDKAERAVWSLIEKHGRTLRAYLWRKFPGLTDDEFKHALTEAARQLINGWETHSKHPNHKALLFNSARWRLIDLLRKQAKSIEAITVKQKNFDPPDQRLNAEDDTESCLRRNSDVPAEIRQSQFDDLCEIISAMEEVDRTIVLHGADSDGEEWTEPLVDELGLTKDHLRVKKHRLMKRIRNELRARGYRFDDDDDSKSEGGVKG